MNLSRKIYVYISRKLRFFSRKNIIKKDNRLLKNIEFVIISDNCWGGAVYQWYGREYNTPFVGLEIPCNCYIKLLSNFDYYMKQKLNFISKTKYPERKVTYPIALLDDVEVHFTHYNSEDEARTKWRRRTDRMLKVTDSNNFYFEFSDNWNAPEKLFKQFHNLPFKNKISFILRSKKSFELPTYIGVNEHHKRDKTRVPNGIKLFKISFLYIDLTYWLITKKIKRGTFKS